MNNFDKAIENTLKQILACRTGTEVATVLKKQYDWWVHNDKL